MANSAKQAFFEKYAPMAMEQQQKYGIPASVTLAQMYIESAGGKSRLAVEGNNYFGIKCPPGWVESGKPYSLHNDDKPNEKFCNYASVRDSVIHHSQFLMQSRYSRCRQLASDDYAGWANGLQKAGYATAKNYASTIQKDIEAYGLDKYDRMAIEDAKKKGIQIGYMRGKTEELGRSVSNGQSLAGNGAGSQQKTFGATGHFSFPLEGEQLVVTSDFGNRKAPVKGASSHHNGLDLRAKFVSILATEDNGKVVKVSEDSKSGKYLHVEYERADGSKYRVAYAHLNRIDVQVGDTVMAGQKIGLSGDSGIAKQGGPHLHFVVRKFDQNGNQTLLNPTEYLAEIAVRGNLTNTLVKRGDSSNKDLLASYKSNMNLQNMPGVLLADNQQQGTEAQAGQELLADNNGFSADQQKMLSELTNSDNPSDWLKYLASQNGDAGLGGSGDIIADLVAMMLSGFLMMSAMMNNDVADNQEKEEPQEAESESQRQENFIRRQRDGIDLKKAQSFASMNFDAEYPERQQSQGVRLA